MAHADLVRAVGLFRALGDENRGLLLHLLDCSRCRLRVQTALLPSPFDDSPPVAPALAERVLHHVLSREQTRDKEWKLDLERAGPLLAELMSLPPEEWEQLVDSEPGLRTPGAAHGLLEAAEEIAAANPEWSERLASLALSVTERLPAAWSETGAAAEVRARSWCWVGEARRLLGDSARAEEAFQNAIGHLVPEPLTTAARALLCRTLARLRYAQERGDEALSLFARAVALLEELRDFDELAEALADQGWVLLEGMEVETALSALLGGVALVDPRRRPRTALRLRHGLALCYCEMGQPAKAHKVVAGNGEQLRSYLADPVDQARLAWIEAEVHERTGDLRRAMRGLEFVLQTLLNLKAFYDAAMAALQLARCYVEDQRTEALLGLRRRIESLQAQGEIPEPPATLLLSVLADLAEQGARSFGLVDRAVDHLERSRHNPGLELQPSP